MEEEVQQISVQNYVSPCHEYDTSKPTSFRKKNESENKNPTHLQVRHRFGSLRAGISAKKEKYIQSKRNKNPSPKIVHLTH